MQWNERPQYLFLLLGTVCDAQSAFTLVNVHRLFCYTEVEASRESGTIGTLCACYAVEKYGCFT